MAARPGGGQAYRECHGEAVAPGALCACRWAWVRGQRGRAISVREESRASSVQSKICIYVCLL
eukprot:scaffold7245_cov119-Isochrysis_galbana.AAC.2